ncbi:MAG: hypothetical protein AAF316_00315 [Cyanobacteria bacterium P01_A01_bin.80]
MTRFNPDADLVPIEEWEEIAESKAAETGAAWRILGGIVAGGAGLALSFEILGVVAGGYLFYQAYEKIKNSGKNLKAVRDFGCVAHVLNEQEFRSFTKQFGDGEVQEQLNFAQDRNWELSKHALNWLECTNKGNTSESGVKAITDDSRASGVDEIKQMGKEFDKRFLEKKKESNEAEFDSIIPGTRTNTENWLDKEETIDVIKNLTNTNTVGNLFIVGLGGSGKGMLTANLLRALKVKFPNKKVFLINGKNDSKEAGYFDEIVDVEKKLNCESAKPQTVAAWFEASIEEYDDYALSNNGALLVIDEGTIIGARLKTAKCTSLNDKLIGITSCGGSTGKNIWFIAQTPYVGANGSDLSGISQLTPIALVSESNLSVIETWKKASLFKKFDVDEISELVSESICKRAIYLGKDTKWYSMPKLKNYSAFDRDTGEMIKKEKQKKPSLETIESSFKMSSVELSEDARKIWNWLLKHESKEWYYYKKSGETERNESFRKMINRLDNPEPLKAFQELVREELIEVSNDDFGIKLL